VRYERQNARQVHVIMTLSRRSSNATVNSSSASGLLFLGLKIGEKYQPGFSGEF
jgi:hypothetical protein